MGVSQESCEKAGVDLQITLDALEDAEAIADDTAEEMAFAPLLAALLA